MSESAKCPQCGASVDPGAANCKYCGEALNQQQAGYPPPEAPGAAPQASPEEKDAQDNKGMAIIAYILFFVPLLAGAHKNSPFVKYHANQGTALFILAAAYSIVSSILSSVIRVPVRLWGVATGVYHTPGWLTAILSIGSLALFALCVLGIINAIGGKMKPLPLVGGFKIIK